VTASSENTRSLLESYLAGALLVKKFGPKEVDRESRFSYTIRLTNTSECPVCSIVMVETLISLLEIESSEPESELSESSMGRWVLGPILPGEHREVVVCCLAKKRLRFRSDTVLSYIPGPGD